MHLKQCQKDQTTFCLEISKQKVTRHKERKRKKPSLAELLCTASETRKCPTFQTALLTAMYPRPQMKQADIFTLSPLHIKLLFSSQPCVVVQTVSRCEGYCILVVIVFCVVQMLLNACSDFILPIHLHQLVLYASSEIKMQKEQLASLR